MGKAGRATGAAVLLLVLKVKLPALTLKELTRSANSFAAPPEKIA
jgi:hypothetical protein